MIFKNRKQKVFCIGRNKTGTTSLEQVLLDFDYKLGDQEKGESFAKDYIKGDWKKFLKFCKTAEAFQDAPFSWPYTWLLLHRHFPDAKFILTVRDEEKWYNSIIKYHTKLFGKGERIPLKADLKRAVYSYKGYMWDANRAIWKTPEDDLYHKETLLANYRRHNEDVLHFFRDKPNFLSIDISEKGSYKKLCEFLDKEPLAEDFPHLNRS